MYLFDKEIKVGDIVFVNLDKDKTRRVPREVELIDENDKSFFILGMGWFSPHKYSCVSGRNSITTPSISKGDTVECKDDDDSGYVGEWTFIAAYNERFICCNSQNIVCYWDEIQLIEEKFEPKPGDRILVSNFEAGWLNREFFIMDGDKYICKDGRIKGHFYSWKNAKRGN